MHAAYVRAWFVGGLAALALSALFATTTLAGAPLAPSAHLVLLVAAISYLALTLTLGLLPAFLRRDWPTPLFALAALGVGALALVVPFQARAFSALLGASLLLGAAQPLALFASPRWTSPRDPDASSDASSRAPTARDPHASSDASSRAQTAREPDAHRATDRAALAALVLSLVGIAAGALLLIAMPRGLPNAALATLLLGGALPAAFGALLFVLPRAVGRPLSGATLALATLVVLALATIALVLGLLDPVRAQLRWPVAGVALAFALGATTLLRARREGPLFASALVLAILAALALLLSTLYGPANALLPVAAYAHAAFALVLLCAALVPAAPLLLPGKMRGARWMAWGPALLIAALFLHAPAYQSGRSVVPATLVAILGLALLLRGLWPLATAPRESAESRRG